MLLVPPLLRGLRKRWAARTRARFGAAETGNAAAVAAAYAVRRSRAAARARRPCVGKQFVAVQGIEWVCEPKNVIKST